MCLTIVGIEIDVTASLRHSVTRYFQQEETPGVCVDDIDKHGIGWIESNLRSHALEVRFGWIEASDSTDAWYSFGRVRSSVCSQRMPDQMNIFRTQIMFLLQFLDQVGDFQTNQTGIRGRLLFWNKIEITISWQFGRNNDFGDLLVCITAASRPPNRRQLHSNFSAR